MNNNLQIYVQRPLFPKNRQILLMIILLLRKQLKRLHWNQSKKLKEEPLLQNLLEMGYLVEQQLGREEKQSIVSARYKYGIFDEKLEKLVDDRIGLQNLVKGEIIIPFLKSQTKYSAIIQNGDFYQNEDLLLDPEFFRLICCFILGDEQIQLGSDAQIIIIPKLTLNGTIIGFEILKDANVQISCVNEKGVPQTFNIKDINFKSQVNLELKFPINQKFPSIESKRDFLLEQICSVTMKLNQQQQIFIKQLRRFDDADGYSIFVLGKNGESYKNVQGQLIFTHSKIYEQIKDNLIGKQVVVHFITDEMDKSRQDFCQLFFQLNTRSKNKNGNQQNLLLQNGSQISENVLIYQLKHSYDGIQASHKDYYFINKLTVIPIKNIRNLIQFEERTNFNLLKSLNSLIKEYFHLYQLKQAILFYSKQLIIPQDNVKITLYFKQKDKKIIQEKLLKSIL
ncbi:unnamed protein product [Paramecium octaurelia]|uniref:Uncharacterized protein n=1 Tax=Paramecium octaurelia TaxID=43137 RepID=A0A8S1W9Z2_PAROT|nr:unnamed protein product [Paramecium octaurelia]